MTTGAPLSALADTTTVVSSYGATGLVADVPKVTEIVGPYFLGSTTS